MIGVLIKGGNLDTETHMNTGRGCEGTLGADHQGGLQAKVGGMYLTLTSQPSERTNPANSLIVDFYPSDL